MPVYNSTMNDVEGINEVCKMSILPLKTTVRGPAPPASPDKDDIIDEALTFFRANVFFKSFEVKGGADRLLIYLTLFIHQCLKKLDKAKDKTDGKQVMYTLACENNFPIPGDSSFAIANYCTAPANKKEADDIRMYLKQCREEISRRILDKAFLEDGSRNKWWLAFSKRKFMNKELR